MRHNTLKLLAFASAVTLGFAATNTSYAETQTVATEIITNSAITLTAGDTMDFGTFAIVHDTNDVVIVLDPLLATNAILQAKIAAENILGEPAKIRKVYNTMVTRAGDFIIASTGCTQEFMERSGKKPMAAQYSGETRAEYNPGKKPLYVRLVADEDSILRGAQIIGGESVVGRINWLALAVQKELSVDELANAESCYNPATSSLFDPVVVAAQILVKKLRRNG